MNWKLIPLLLLLLACKKEIQSPVVKLPDIGLITENAMVVSAREEASRIGMEILQKGGNAFDAMVATELALAVSYPRAGNLGGGGFLVYRTQFGELGTFDYREKAPIKAHRNMYLDDEGNFIQEKSKVGSMAVGVPGTIAGVFAVHKKLGSLPIEELFAPVIELARDGFVITEMQAENFAEFIPVIEEVNGESSIFTQFYKAGDTLKNIALANTLSRISENGRSEFYSGETAGKLVEFITSRGGIITKDDLEAYEAELRDPIVFNYKDLKLISMAPPSSGGICLGQILKSVEPYPLGDYGHNSVKAIQLITEAERRAYADRSYFLGDPDFIDAPLDSLLSEAYLTARMADFTFDKATPSTEITYGSIPGYEKYQNESTETTHYSIVDQFGNAIAATTTLNSYFGSKLYSKELGFFLNNEMDDFSAKPGEANIYGLIGGEANAVAPQKRMLSSMTPTLVEKDGQLWMSLGTPGGSSIITSVLQTILNVYEFDMNMQQAVNAPRFHHQWLPDAIQFEPNKFSRETLKKLKVLGYTIDEVNAPVIGKVDAILIRHDGKLESGADRRGDDTAAGY